MLRVAYRRLSLHCQFANIFHAVPPYQAAGVGQLTGIGCRVLRGLRSSRQVPGNCGETAAMSNT